MRRPLALLAAAGLTLACGKKGDPHPPLPGGPARTSDLEAAQHANTAILTLAFPSLRQDGAALADLARISVYRFVEPPPSIFEAGAPSGGAAADRAPIAGQRRRAQSERSREEIFLAAAEKIGVLEGPALTSATRGSRLEIRDDLSPLLRSPSPPRRLAYAIVSQRGGGEASPLSNVARLDVAVPLAAPTNLLAEGFEREICLSWNAPESDEAGRPAFPAGYQIYRRRISDEEFDRPLNSAPAATPDYADTSASYGETYVYTVTALEKDHPKSEGLPAIQFGIEYRDVYPPPPVARLDALPEENLVRLLWTASDAVDLAGYVVLRAEGSGEFQRLNREPVAETEFVDRNVAADHTYRYAVEAVDKTGNLSAPSPETPARPFRTP